MTGSVGIWSDALNGREPTVRLHSYRSIPADVMAFWRQAQADQDPYRGVTASPEWFQMMADGGDPEAAVAVLASERGFQAVIPLFASSWTVDIRFGGRRLLNKTLKVLRAGGGDPIVRDASAADLRSVWRHVFSERPDIQGILFDRVQCGPRHETLVASAGCFTRFRVACVSPRMPHYRLMLPPTLADARALRSAETLRKIERRERALARETGAVVSLVEIRQPGDWAPFASELEKMMSRTWQAERLGHGFSLEGMATVASHGWLRSFVLMVGAEPAAFALCYQGGGALVYDQIGYNRRWARHSPGTLLLHRLIERLYEHECPACLDFGEGDAEYKRNLANHQVEVQAMAIMRRKVSLAAVLSISQLTRSVNAMMKRLMANRHLAAWHPSAGRSDTGGK